MIYRLERAKSPDLSQYGNVVIDGGLRAEKVYDKALKFLENDLSGKRVACFVSLSQAETPASFEKAKIKFVEDTLSKYTNINAVATEAFGGRIRWLEKPLKIILTSPE